MCKKRNKQLNLTFAACGSIAGHPVCGASGGAQQSMAEDRESSE